MPVVPNDKIKIYEPLAEFLGNSSELVHFELGLIDAARLSGHLCPSVAGAFLLTRKAVQLLYPDTHICVRGQIEIHLPGPPSQDALGPMANVISFITGAWSETGFGGLSGGRYARRNLLHFSSQLCQHREFIFIRMDTKSSIRLSYNPTSLLQELKSANAGMSFQDSWQANVRAILSSNDVVRHL